MVIFISCNNNSDRNVHVLGEDGLGMLILDTCSFDTLNYISQLNINEHQNLLEKYYVDPKYNEELDTVELKYIHYACLCPNWIMVDSLERSVSSPSYSGYYLRPAFDEIDLPTDLYYGTRIRLIGQVSKEMYNYELFMSGNGDANDDQPGYEFKYYYYEILKPYYILGPEVCRYDVWDDTIIYRREEIIIE